MPQLRFLVCIVYEVLSSHRIELIGDSTICCHVSPRTMSANAAIIALTSLVFLYFVDILCAWSDPMYSLNRFACLSTHCLTLLDPFSSEMTFFLSFGSSTHCLTLLDPFSSEMTFFLSFGSSTPHTHRSVSSLSVDLLPLSLQLFELLPCASCH
eukprot:996243_1